MTRQPVEERSRSAKPTPGDDTIARSAAEFRSRRQLRHQKIKSAAELIDQGQTEAAHALLSRYLEMNPSDASALNLMGEIALKQGENSTAEGLLARCVALSPDFGLARFNYARCLYNLNKLPPALVQLDVLLETDAHNFLALDLRSVVLAVMGRHTDAIVCRRQLVDDHPGAPEVWIKYASLHRSLGQTEACIAALRKAIELQPSRGSAYWALADLKTYHFSDAEVAAMHAQLLRTDLSRDDRVCFHFALGKSYGDRGEFAKSFENYARGNALMRMDVQYNADDFARHVARSKAGLTAGFFRAHEGGGHDASDPIFIVGMQRAGSTLVEQVLASHSAIEATGELPDITLLIEHIARRVAPEHGSQYPDVLAAIDPDSFREWGQNYLQSTRFRRVLGRRHFVDKLPYNFMHLGLLRLILPNARVIDVRRHPLGCCFSNFSMHFEVGPLFSHRLNELGRAYSDYVELMAHFDEVLPDYVHRVFYEDIVASPEAEIRRLLDFLGLPFEDSCLRFHENTRTMSSISAEQVRRPISDSASGFWRNYEPWLGPLKAALGPVLDAYPAVPAFNA